MINFKHTELISWTEISCVILLTILILAIVGFFLWLLKKNGLVNSKTPQTKEIEIVDIVTDVRFGTIAIIKAYDQRHLLAVSKAGICLNQIKPELP